MITTFENRCVIKNYLIVLRPFFDTTYKGKNRPKNTCEIYITNWYYSYKVGLAMYQSMRPKRTYWAEPRQYLSIPVLPKLWDTELLCTEYAQNYWLTRVPVDSSPRRLSVDRRRNYLARFLFNSSHRRLSFDRHWNYSAQVLVDSSPQHPSINRRWNYLARVPVGCPSTDVENV